MKSIKFKHGTTESALVTGQTPGEREVEESRLGHRGITGDGALSTVELASYITTRNIHRLLSTQLRQITSTLLDFTIYTPDFINGAVDTSIVAPSVYAIDDSNRRRPRHCRACRFVGIPVAQQIPTEDGQYIGVILCDLQPITWDTEQDTLDNPAYSYLNVTRGIPFIKNNGIHSNTVCGDVYERFNGEVVINIFHVEASVYVTKITLIVEKHGTTIYRTKWVGRTFADDSRKKYSFVFSDYDRTTHANGVIRLMRARVGVDSETRGDYIFHRSRFVTTKRGRSLNNGHFEILSNSTRVNIKLSRSNIYRPTRDAVIVYKQRTHSNYRYSVFNSLAVKQLTPDAVDCVVETYARFTYVDKDVLFNSRCSYELGGPNIKWEVNKSGRLIDAPGDNFYKALVVTTAARDEERFGHFDSRWAQKALPVSLCVSAGYLLVFTRNPIGHFPTGNSLNYENYQGLPGICKHLRDVMDIVLYVGATSSHTNSRTPGLLQRRTCKVGNFNPWLSSCSPGYLEVGTIMVSPHEDANAPTNDVYNNIVNFSTDASIENYGKLIKGAINAFMYSPSGDLTVGFNSLHNSEEPAMTFHYANTNNIAEWVHCLDSKDDGSMARKCYSPDLINGDCIEDMLVITTVNEDPKTSVCTEELEYMF